MADIVERLRGWSGQAAPVSSTDIYAVTQEAAAEIEKLREEVLQAGAMIFEQAKTIQSLQKAADEIERLRERTHYAEGTADANIARADEARNAALEEAAKVADGKAEKAIDFAPHIGRAATEIAAAIRTLKDTP